MKRLKELEDEVAELRSRPGPADGPWLSLAGLRVLLCEYGRATENPGYRRVGNNEHDSDKDELWSVDRLEEVGDKPPCIRLSVERGYSRRRGLLDVRRRAELELGGVIRGLRGLQGATSVELASVDAERFGEKLASLQAREAELKATLARADEGLRECREETFYFALDCPLEGVNLADLRV